MLVLRSRKTTEEMRGKSGGVVEIRGRAGLKRSWQERSVFVTGVSLKVIRYESAAFEESRLVKIPAGAEL